LSGLSLKDKIETQWDDEKILNKLKLFLNDKVKVGVKFFTDEDDLIHGYSIVFVAGEKVLPSGAVEFDWPWQPMPIPEALKGKLN
jgi:hypothetical protein